MQMLRDRGYLVVAAKDIDINMRQFLEKYGENPKRDELVINKQKKNDNNDQVHHFLIFDCGCSLEEKKKKLGLSFL